MLEEGGGIDARCLCLQEVDMTRHVDFLAFPPDVRSLWGANGEYAGKAYQAWLETAGRIQGDAMEFVRSRLEKDVAALADLGKCTTAVEAFNVQFAYARDTFADYVGEGQKIAAMLNDAARESMPGVSESPAAPKRTLRKGGVHSGH